VQGVVIVPTFDRPEMLWLCLQHIAACPEASRLAVAVQLDGRDGAAADEVAAVVQAMDLRLSLQIWTTKRHTYPGNSYNVIQGYRRAAAVGYKRVFMVEDDVLVAPEFFAWHEQVHAMNRLAASIGVANPGHGAYASLGVRLTEQTIGRILAFGDNDAYYSDMRGYCRKFFPSSQFDCEQDGLIARLLAGQSVAWADPPVCSHVGWYGYHRTRTTRPTGTLEERRQQVVEIAADPTILEAYARLRTDVRITTERNVGTYTLSTVPGAAA
jgi:hypothetical protein